MLTNFKGLERELQKWEMINKGVEVKLILINGFQMRGEIKSMGDGWIIFWDSADQNEKIVLIQAISTIC